MTTSNNQELETVKKIADNLRLEGVTDLHKALHQLLIAEFGNQYDLRLLVSAISHLREKFNGKGVLKTVFDRPQPEINSENKKGQCLVYNRIIVNATSNAPATLRHPEIDAALDMAEQARATGCKLFNANHLLKSGVDNIQLCDIAFNLAKKSVERAYDLICEKHNVILAKG